MSKETHQKTKQHPRYSIFRNPLFNEPALNYQKVPFHISYSGNYEYECVIDHSKDSISTRKNALTRSVQNRSQSNGSKRRIFSQKKRNSADYETMSPVQLILSRREESFERQTRKLKIFGQYSTLNSNEPANNRRKNTNNVQNRHSTIKNLQNRHSISYTNTVVVQQQRQQKQQRQSSPQLKLLDGHRQNIARQPKQEIDPQYAGLEPLNPLQFAKLMFDFRLSQRIKHQRLRQRQQSKQQTMATNSQPKHVKFL